MATIQITDGTTTLNLYDSASYAIVNRSWSPSVAVLARDVLGGDPYAPVIETMQLRVKGTTTANCLSNLHTLSALITQADRWYRGENVDPVVFVYQPTGSTLGTAARAAILGAPPDTAAIETSGNVELINTNNYQLFPVNLSFLRRGAWLGAEESQSSSTTANPAVLTSTFGTASKVASPVHITMTDYIDSGADDEYSYFFVTSDADKMAVNNASGMTSTNYTSTGIANALGGAALTYTPPDTSVHRSGNLTISSILDATTQSVGVWLCFQINNTTVDATVRGVVTIGSGTEFVTPWVKISPEASTYRPRIIYLGNIFLPVGVGDVSANFFIDIQASAATGTMYVDSAAFLDIGDSESYAVKVLSNSLSTNQSIEIDHRQLTKNTPLISSVTGSLPIPHEGNPVFYTSGTTVNLMWYANGNGNNLFRAFDGASVATNQLTAKRRVAYLVPQ